MTMTSVEMNVLICSRLYDDQTHAHGTSVLLTFVSYFVFISLKSPEGHEILLLSVFFGIILLTLLVYAAFGRCSYDTTLMFLNFLHASIKHSLG